MYIQIKNSSILESKVVIYIDIEFDLAPLKAGILKKPYMGEIFR